MQGEQYQWKAFCLNHLYVWHRKTATLTDTGRNVRRTPWLSGLTGGDEGFCTISLVEWVATFADEATGVATSGGGCAQLLGVGAPECVWFTRQSWDSVNHIIITFVITVVARIFSGRLSLLLKQPVVTLLVCCTENWKEIKLKQREREKTTTTNNKALEAITGVANVSDTCVLASTKKNPKKTTTWGWESGWRGCNLWL